MRLATKMIATLGFVSAVTLGASSPAPAQGVYFSGPGVEFGVGPRHHYYRHYRYHRSWAYARPYWRHHRYRRWDWD